MSSWTGIYIQQNTVIASLEAPGYGTKRDACIVIFSGE